MHYIFKELVQVEKYDLKNYSLEGKTWLKMYKMK